MSRRTAAAQLAPAGYILRFASSGEEALARVEQERPDLVLLDVMMPGMSGFEVCRRLRERLREDYVPIILLRRWGAATSSGGWRRGRMTSWAGPSTARS